MRIDVVTDTYEPDVNGVALTLGRLVGGLRMRGHLVHVMRASERNGSFNPGETAMPSLPLPMYHEVKIGLPSADRFRARWMKKRPDVVYVATESPMGASAVKAARTLEVPVVMGFHTNFHQYMKDYHFSRLETAAVNYLRKLHNRAGMTVVPTEEMRRTLEGLGFERLSVMGRGVDAVLFDPARRDASLRQSWGVWRDEVVFGVVGRLAREKNLVAALGLYTRLQREFPDCGMKMVVVGDGPMMNSLRSEFPDAVFAECAVGKTWRAIMPPWTFYCSPVRRKLSGTFCWKAWPVVWLRSATGMPLPRMWCWTASTAFRRRKGMKRGFIPPCAVCWKTGR